MPTIVKVNVPDGYMIDIVPIAKSSQAVNKQWLDEIRDKFRGIDIDREAEKARAWCAQNARRLTRKMFVNWLGRIDPDEWGNKRKAWIRARVKELKATAFVDSMGVETYQDPSTADELAQLKKEWDSL